MMNITQFTEQLNRLINKATSNLGSGGGTLLNTAAIASALTAQAAAVTALSGVTHDRTIQDHGAALNPTQPR
jgi:hypothetical protein